MQSTLNTELLSAMIKSKRANKGLRAAAEEIGGVSFATLSRVEQGNIPDVDTFIKICRWLNVATDTFIISDETLRTASTKDYLIAHLRADKELNKEMASMLIKMIDMAYTTQ